MEGLASCVYVHASPWYSLHFARNLFEQEVDVSKVFGEGEVAIRFSVGKQGLQGPWRIQRQLITHQASG
jgi:hypothetical protein